MDTDAAYIVGTVAASYSTGLLFKPRLGDRLFWLQFFLLFLSPSRPVSRQYSKLGHDRFPTRPKSLFTGDPNDPHPQYHY